MKVGAKNDRGQRSKDEITTMIRNTINSYTQMATKLSKKHQLDGKQKEQIKKQWINVNKVYLDDKGSNIKPEEWAEKQIDGVLNTAMEVSDMLAQVRTCNVDNTIHTAKLTRLSEAHKAKAKAYTTRQREEVRKAKRHKNDSKDKGLKHISKAIGDPQARPLTCVYRDRDIVEDGKAGHITTNPADADAIVTRAWERCTMA